MAYDSGGDRIVPYGGDFSNDLSTREYHAPVIAPAAFTPYGTGRQSSAACSDSPPRRAASRSSAVRFASKSVRSPPDC